MQAGDLFGGGEERAVVGKVVGYVGVQIKNVQATIDLVPDATPPTVRFVKPVDRSAWLGQ